MSKLLALMLKKAILGTKFITFADIADKIHVSLKKNSKDIAQIIICC